MNMTVDKVREDIYDTNATKDKELLVTELLCLLELSQYFLHEKTEIDYQINNYKIRSEQLSSNIKQNNIVDCIRDKIG